MSGSFSRAVKVQKLEATIRIAVASQRSAPPGEARGLKDIAVRKIAAKLLQARLQLLRSRDVLSRKEKMRAAGVAAILSEFGADKY